MELSHETTHNTNQQIKPCKTICESTTFFYFQHNINYVVLCLLGTSLNLHLNVYKRHVKH